MQDQKLENKAAQPSENPVQENGGAGKATTVRVRVNHGRTVKGVGVAGETKSIDQELAKDLQRQGLVTILK